MRSPKKAAERHLVQYELSDSAFADPELKKLYTHTFSLSDTVQL